LTMWTNGKRQSDYFKKNGVPPILLEKNCGHPGDEPDMDCDRLRTVANLIAVKSNSEAGPPLWKEYVKFVPDLRGFREYHPGTASESLLQTFEKLPVVSDIRNQQKLCDQRYDMYRNAGGNGSKEEFMWGNTVYHSYGWRGPYDNGEMIVPFADSFNAALEDKENIREVRQGADEQKAFDEGGFFQLMATADIQPGAEVVGPYNTLPDDAWATNWGFLIRNRKSGNESNMARYNPSETDCEHLLAKVAPVLSSLEGPCNPPEKEPQKGAFCTLSRLVYEHCGDERQSKRI